MNDTRDRERTHGGTRGTSIRTRAHARPRPRTRDSAGAGDVVPGGLVSATKSAAQLIAETDELIEEVDLWWARRVKFRDAEAAAERLRVLFELAARGRAPGAFEASAVTAFRVVASVFGVEVAGRTEKTDGTTD